MTDEEIEAVVANGQEATALACGYAGPAPYMNDGLRGDAAFAAATPPRSE